MRMCLTLGTAAWKRKSVKMVLPEFWANIFMTNRSGISGGLSNLNVILSPDLSKTTMLGSSVMTIMIIMIYMLINPWYSFRCYDEPFCTDGVLSNPSTKKLLLLVGLNIGGDDACGWSGNVGVTGVGVFKSKLPSKSSRSLLCVTAVELGEEFLLVVAAGIVTPTSVVPSKSKSALCNIEKKKRIWETDRAFQFIYGKSNLF